MERLYTVRLAHNELDDYWHEGQDYDANDERFGNSADDRWFRTYDVYLVDDLDHAVGAMGWAGVDSFLMHYSICSPAAKRSPPPELGDELRTALIQNSFDEASAFEYFQNYLARLPPLPVRELIQALQQQLYFLPK